MNENARISREEGYNTMRFRNIDKQEHPAEQSKIRSSDENQSEEIASAETSPRATCAKTCGGAASTLRPLGEDQPAAAGRSIAPEWLPLARFIETEQCRHLSDDQMKSFVHQLRERLDEVQRQDEAVHDWLKRTFWRRWLVRGIAAAIVAILLALLFLKQHEIRALHERLALAPDAQSETVVLG